MPPCGRHSVVTVACRSIDAPRGRYGVARVATGRTTPFGPLAPSPKPTLRAAFAAIPALARTVEGVEESIEAPGTRDESRVPDGDDVPLLPGATSQAWRSCSTLSGPSAFLPDATACATLTGTQGVSPVVDSANVTAPLQRLAAALQRRGQALCGSIRVVAASGAGGREEGRLAAPLRRPRGASRTVI